MAQVKGGYRLRVASDFTRVLRAARIAATDKRIPRPLRWLAALGLAPIPGPFDEALLLRCGPARSVLQRTARGCLAAG